MLDILEGTPPWGYAVFALICHYGLRAFSPTRESRRSLLLMPSILLASQVEGRIHVHGHRLLM